MYSKQKVPAPFCDKPMQKIVPSTEKAKKTEKANITKETRMPAPKTTDSPLPLLAFLFLEVFSTQKKDGTAVGFKKT